jgi:hypothetical protein
MLQPGDEMFLPALDAGSEENNEDCASIPGPDCEGKGDNDNPGGGEGVVHVHRGFHGVGDLLPAQAYDWRNPMAIVRVSAKYEIYEH